MQKKFTLCRKQSQVLLLPEGKKDEIPVKIMWVRPLTGKGKDISFLDKDKKEVAMLHDMETLEPISRGIVIEELEKRYLIPKIKRIHKTRAEYGARYWDVETELGRRTFAMREPHRNIVWVNKEKVILRDTIGNRYEIEHVSALDKASRREFEKMV